MLAGLYVQLKQYCRSKRLVYFIVESISILLAKKNLGKTIKSIINYIRSKLVSVANYHHLNFLATDITPMEERFGLPRDNIVMPGIETVFASRDMKRWKEEEMV